MTRWWFQICFIFTPIWGRFASVGSTWENICGNRYADKFAKLAVNEAIAGRTFHPPDDSVSRWQAWLAQVNSKLGEISSVETNFPVQNNQIEMTPGETAPSELTIAHPIETLEKILPLWCWKLDQFAFNWKPTFPSDCNLETYASITPTNWKIAIKFLNELTWECKPHHQTAYIEIAFSAWYTGVRFEGISSNPKEYATTFRKCINQAAKLSSLGELVPGPQKAEYKSNGRTIPAGFIQGGWPNISPICLKQLALCFFKGKTQKLGDWGTPFL